jgi:hypothetical protein
MLIVKLLTKTTCHTDYIDKKDVAIVALWEIFDAR